MILGLTARFSIRPDRQDVEEYRKCRHGKEVAPQIGKGAAGQQNEPHHLDEPCNWVEPGDDLRPLGHRLDGGEQSSHQNENDHKEPCDKHRLLLCLSVGGDKQSHGKHNQQVKEREGEQGHQTPPHRNIEK